MKCYLVAACESSSLDVSTNNWSLFNLIEEAQAHGDLAKVKGDERAMVPFQIHAFFEFEPDEIGKTFQWRPVVTSRTDDTVTLTPKEPFHVTPGTARHRARLAGVPVPSGSDQLEIHVEYRLEGTDDWTRSGAYWPLQVEFIA